MPQKLLRKKPTLEQTGLTHSSLYELIKKGQFPKPVKLSEKSVAWVESEIQEWIQNRIELRGDTEQEKRLV